MSQKVWLLISQFPQAEQALFDWMLGCAAEQGAQLEVLTVLPELESLWLMQEFMPNLAAQKQRAEQQAYLKRANWVEQGAAVGVKVEQVVRFGKLFYQAIVHALERQPEWVVKQIEPQQQGLNSALLGSQEMHLLRKCPFPLLLQKPNAVLPFQRVLASLDVNLETWPPKPSPLNQQLLYWAQRMAGKRSWQVVHAWQADLENLVRHWDTNLEESQWAQLKEQLYLQRKMALDVELQEAEADANRLQAFLVEGAADKAILEHSLRQQIDLLVMGTVGRSGLAGLLIGNTAENILERAEFSILAVKPADFVCPIRL
ncbi:MAG: universal stress protein [Thiotrichales bacterium]|nr:universal stress protein [Thiotrichales bacterium]